MEKRRSPEIEISVPRRLKQQLKARYSPVLLLIIRDTDRACRAKAETAIDDSSRTSRTIEHHEDIDLLFASTLCLISYASETSIYVQYLIWFGENDILKKIQ